MRNVAKLFAVLTVAGVAAAAEASPITYDFTMRATDGPLAGAVANGTFSFDSSSITPGARNNTHGALTALNFTWDGITYDATTANTGQLTFDTAGNLVQAIFGNSCGAGFCGLDGGFEEWDVDAGPGSGFGLGSYSMTSYPGIYDARVTMSRAVVANAPEPLTLSLFGAGLAGFAAMRRRRRKAA